MEINDIFAKDGSIKSEIRKEIISRMNFCRQATKEAIPTLVKLPDGMEMTEERLEILTHSILNQLPFLIFSNIFK